MTADRVPNPFGTRLRDWRRLRGLSQLGLALQAGTTPRHLSFLESGRSRPGSDIVLRLADALRFPHDAQLRALHDMALAATSGTVTSAAPIASPRLRLGTHRIDTISVVSQFSSPRHATVQELRIELLHPADDHGERVLRQLAHAGHDTDQSCPVEQPQ